jgi:hypothetical protein
MTFEQWLLSIGKSPKSAKNYASAIAGPINKWAIEASLININFVDITALNEFTCVAEKLKMLDVFIAHNKNGNGMYKAALNHYASFLNDVSGSSIFDDVENINKDKSISLTEKKALINARVGQGSFRHSLITYWNGCAVTKFKDHRFLVASHIKPWRFSNNEERLDSYNGLLLIPNLDKAFDLGHISFKENGAVLISKNLDEPNALGIHGDLKISLSEKHLGFMEFHRSVIFENNF